MSTLGLAGTTISSIGSFDFTDVLLQLLLLGRHVHLGLGRYHDLLHRLFRFHRCTPSAPPSRPSCPPWAWQVPRSPPSALSISPMYSFSSSFSAVMSTLGLAGTTISSIGSFDF